MKILFVKNSSERAKPYQIQTLIYEENGQKFVQKRALCPEATAHLMQMKANHKALATSILDPRIKLAPIIDERADTLTFEFIEGESLESRFDNALQTNQASVDTLINTFYDRMRTAFKTVPFDSKTMVSSTFSGLFGEYDYSRFDGMPAFEGVSNIDLIFSNIIFRGEDIYLIDYEWCMPFALPVEYVFFRALLMLPRNIQGYPERYIDQTLLCHKMERNLIDRTILAGGFYFYQERYLKTNSEIGRQIEAQKAHIAGLEAHLEAHASAIKEKDEWITYLQEAAESMRLKNRLLRLAQKFVPGPIRQKLQRHIARDASYHVPRYHYEAPSLTDDVAKQLANLPRKPLISIIMPVYNVDPRWLDLAIESIQRQWYPHWELCIADDCSTNLETINYLEALDDTRIKIRRLEQNGNISIASNAAIDLATGEYLALMDNDDELTPDALYEMVRKLNETDADLIYSDEDFVTTEGVYTNPHFKPDFSPNLLLSHNYMTHLTLFKRTLLDRAGKFDPLYDGAQDFDLFLRLTEQTEKIAHIPKVLYHWRLLESSTALNAHAKPEAHERGRRALIEALQRRGIRASVVDANMAHYFRVRYEIIGTPLVTIVIPFKDKPELLKVCIESILEKSTWPHFEIIAISNNSQEPETFTLMQSLEARDSRVQCHEYNVPFNYSQINNHAISTYARGEHILLLNNDIEVITPDWIEAMLEHSQRPEIGCVGAKLYYPNDLVQHAGIIIGLGGYAGHSHKLSKRHKPGYFNRLSVVQDISAVTGACLMVKRSIYQAMDGLNAVEFKVAYNDVDFCLRVQEAGYHNVFTPFAQMYHHESITRGYEDTPEKQARFETEKAHLYARHTQILTHGDPFYNPNLTSSREDFGLSEALLR
jgi:glycosyltransferase involved in cell wall biosynthesis